MVCVGPASLDGGQDVSLYGAMGTGADTHVQSKRTLASGAPAEPGGQPSVVHEKLQREQVQSVVAMGRVVSHEHSA